MEEASMSERMFVRNTEFERKCIYIWKSRTENAKRKIFEYLFLGYLMVPRAVAAMACEKIEAIGVVFYP